MIPAGGLSQPWVGHLDDLAAQARDPCAAGVCVGRCECHPSYSRQTAEGRARASARDVVLDLAMHPAHRAALAEANHRALAGLLTKDHR